MTEEEQVGFLGARFVVLDPRCGQERLQWVSFPDREGLLVGMEDDSSGVEESSGVELSEPSLAELGLQESTGPRDATAVRLIERFFPSEAVSEASRKERYQRGKTPHTIFTWWARRPFAAVCGVVATSLIQGDVQVGQVRELIDDYCREAGRGLSKFGVEQLMREGEQRVLDMFSGGATIPLEAAYIGTRAYSVDNNELAHFIQLALLNYSQVGADLPDLVEREGRVLLEALHEETAAFFPARDAGEAGRTIAYVWSRQVDCPECGGELVLSKRPWLVKRKGRLMHVARRPDGASKRYFVALRDHGDPPEDGSAWAGRRVVCPFCEATLEREALVEAMAQTGREALGAMVRSTGRSERGHKSYARDEGALPDEAVLDAALADDLAALAGALPGAELPQWSGVTNPALYGLAKHVDLFSKRQLAVLVRLCRLLGEHYGRWESSHGSEKARALAAFLSALIDQLVDWNSRLATWIAQNEQVGRALSGPGIPMVWDFAEIDPTEESPANLWDKLDRIVRGLKSVPDFKHAPVVLKSDARELPFEDGFFDVVATDPPYFDNLYYNVLADCIFVWKRLALGRIFPEVFEEATTDPSRELTMNRHVHDTAELAQRYYTRGMTEVLKEVWRVLKPGGVLSMIFAHSAVEAWAAIAQSFDEADLELVAAWPMSVERSERPRAMRARAVNTSFVLVGKRRQARPVEVAWSEVMAALLARLLHDYEQLQAEEGMPVDQIGRTLFGSAVAILSKAGRPVVGGEVLGWEVLLARAAELVESIVEGFEMSRR
ncbi:DUF1156 domain-containing protein [Lujinxingia vulgaris]|uniref:DUF1156 domain-containing protein n=1 Tax=Lujinxingia vulgaris TaxID=2600176 RepID=A0A5C6X6K5_9DELT|nr:DUF1156 domain-containing protein [Lujinxingia vulgaris]TXD33580.1 DUF1156 domain-containing protein [Lujinxingia vulgaris]